jgi:hypothetical protein
MVNFAHALLSCLAVQERTVFGIPPRLSFNFEHEFGDV